MGAALTAQPFSPAPLIIIVMVEMMIKKIIMMIKKIIMMTKIIIMRINVMKTFMIMMDHHWNYHH